MLPDAGKFIEQIAEALYPVSATFREQYDQNRCAASRLPFTKESLVSPKLIQPSAYNGTSREIVDTYFSKSTPLEALSSARLPFGIPEAQRGEHWHLLGGSGHGKTQTLSHIIMSDFKSPTRRRSSSSTVRTRCCGRFSGSRFSIRIRPVHLPIASSSSTRKTTRRRRSICSRLTTRGWAAIRASRARDRRRRHPPALQLHVRVACGRTLDPDGHRLRVCHRVSCFRCSRRRRSTRFSIFCEEDVKRAEQSKFYNHIAALDPTARGFFEKQFYKNPSFAQTRNVARAPPL